jgi:hypothetical protein
MVERALRHNLSLTPAELEIQVNRWKWSERLFLALVKNQLVSYFGPDPSGLEFVRFLLSARRFLTSSCWAPALGMPIMPLFSIPKDSNMK